MKIARLLMKPPFARAIRLSEIEGMNNVPVNRSGHTVRAEEIGFCITSANPLRPLRFIDFSIEKTKWPCPFAAAIAGLLLFSAAAAAPRQDKPEPPKIIRKSGGVLQASATKRVEPAYPPLAKASRVSGVVVVEVTVDEAGDVISARAISGHPLLKDSAVAAARQWTFTPTQLNGVPVKVIETIAFNFNLAQSSAEDSDTQRVITGVPGGVPGGVPEGEQDTGRDSASPHGGGRSTANPARLAAMIEQSGYRYSKVAEGVWEIAATGKNIGEFSIRTTMAGEIVLMLVKLADRKDVTAKSALLLKLLELNHRFDLARIALSEEMLYARIDIRVRVTDSEEFNFAVEQLASAADEIYPQIKSFIASDSAPQNAHPRPQVMANPTAAPSDEPVIMNPAARPHDASASKQASAEERNSAVDSKPVALNNPIPRYAKEARDNKVQGIVRLRILVGADGLVKQAKVTAGLPDGLNEQALETAYQMRFKPAMKDGRPVAYWLSVEIVFRLE